MPNRLINAKALDAECEAAHASKRTRPELTAALNGAAGGARVTLRELHALLSSAQTESAVALRHIAKAAEAALDALEDRLAALERTALVWAGPWAAEKSYTPNDLTQRGAGLYVALVATKAGDAPGASASWRRIAESRA